MQKVIILLILFSLSGVSYAQDADSLIYKPSPRGAMFRSAVIPGWGQLYNKKPFKTILVIGGSIALVGNAIYYNQLSMKNEFEGDLEYYGSVRNQFVWYSVLLYLLNLMDAYIDAHLYDFDAGPDLSFQNSYNDFSSLRMCFQICF